MSESACAPQPTPVAHIITVTPGKARADLLTQGHQQSLTFYEAANNANMCVLF